MPKRKGGCSTIYSARQARVSVKQKKGEKKDSVVESYELGLKDKLSRRLSAVAINRHIDKSANNLGPRCII
jgi:hypothetical protein